MKTYDVISVGTGSAMSIVNELIHSDRDHDIAVIDRDRPGGICLTRGCIPSKLLLYPAELIDHIREANRFGIDVSIDDIDFEEVMNEMRRNINSEISSIKNALDKSGDMDFYNKEAEFIDDYTMRVGESVIKGDKIILGSGSRPHIPPIDGLDDVDFLTSKSLLDLKKLPKSIAIIGGGYIAAEYGYFFSMMGSDVKIIGRNPQFVPGEEEEISDVLKEKLSDHISIHTGYEVKKVKDGIRNKKLFAEGEDGKKIKLKSKKILLATGRRSNSDILKPDRTGVETDKRGWIKVNEYLETTKEDIWALGDATGDYMFKHVANYESEIVYKNAFGEGEKVKVDYHAVPHAVFTQPEVASVGMREDEAREFGDILVGYYPFENTAKGDAMKVSDCFIKVIVEKSTYKILGAHIVGPQASVLIQEIINLMYTQDQSVYPIFRGMHIHPSLSEVVERAFYSLHSHEHTHDDD